MTELDIFCFLLKVICGNEAETGTMRKVVMKEVETRRIGTKNGKLPKSHRYNRLPLLRSHPGGFTGAGCLGLAGAKINL